MKGVKAKPLPGCIVICGATATGKSGLAIALAQRLGSVILSADSRQVYREFDIGTAKPTPEELQLVPHYLIDCCNPIAQLTLADYQQQAQYLIAEQHQKNPDSPPLLVGGTGLYIKSVTKGLKIPRVSPHPELRSQLAALGQPQCYQMLQQVDPTAATKIHANDATRTLRALEVYTVTGRPLSQQQGQDPPDYPILHLGLACDPEALDRRIHQRTRQMVEMGFVAEVETLIRRYGSDLPLLNTLGYAEMKRYLAGEISVEEAVELTALHTRQFAKRQRTWFNAYPEIEWFDADAPDLRDRVLTRILSEMR
ncbi:tRNA (adenosine(37)-N6)-dimethylallyltransferase MiaA [Baaleninema simplex]|uniref:tRNA (adenosine(37)-N6)-dimethylallyltransferase MiaA n=1 Tax=Baaleninema simplex TaxID=2862350 RepID=UPI001FE0765B|nr:tRNA (adenosine(37)-N6)-dimethylallyltransferase MiaA [Baaleninema simplex]